MKLFFTTIAAVLVSRSLAQDTGLTVQTQQGAVTGTLVTAGVRQFLGVPYAVANRWQDPQPPPSRSTTFQATSFGDSCVQELSASNLEFLTLTDLANQQVQESENCLSVNIWAPSSDRKQSTAVLLWIYGGGFEFGTSNTIFYNGQFFVGDNDDITLVSINYRTNIFGFPNAPQLSNTTQSQNFGALDVETAIQWVSQNIAAFGGDPGRITIFGQSAGSGLTDAYTYAHPSDTIVKGVIEQSGSLAGMPSSLTAFGGPLDPTGWNVVANAVGCGSDATAAQLSCMQGVPFRTVENAVISTNSDFVPVQDGITFFSDTTSRSSAGNFLHVPLLVGNTDQEGDIFVVGLEQENLGFDIPGLTEAAGDAVTKVVFTCPAGTTAGDRVKAGVPTWRYRYDAVFSDISSRSDLRAYHASEIPIVFGTYNSSPIGSPTGVEITLSEYVQGAWVAFARDPAQGLTNYGWPLYSPNTNSLAQLGNSANQTGVVFAQGGSFDGGCGAAEAGVSLVLKVISLLGSIF